MAPFFAFHCNKKNPVWEMKPSPFLKVLKMGKSPLKAKLVKNREIRKKKFQLPTN